MVDNNETTINPDMENKLENDNDHICKFVKNFIDGTCICEICGKEKNLWIEEKIKRRSIPVSSYKWMRHIDDKPCEIRFSRLKKDVSQFLRKYIYEESIIEQITEQWNKLLINMQPKTLRGDLREGCLILLILKIYPSISEVQYEVSESVLHKARNILKDYMDDIPECNNIETELHKYFYNNKWNKDKFSNIDFIYNSLSKLEIRYFKTGSKYIRACDNTLRAISVLMDYVQNNWEPGMAFGGKYLQTITEQVTKVARVNRRTIRCPLQQLKYLKDGLKKKKYVNRSLKTYELVEKSYRMYDKNNNFPSCFFHFYDDYSNDSIINVKSNNINGSTTLKIDFRATCFHDLENITHSQIPYNKINYLSHIKWTLRHFYTGSFLLTVNSDRYHAQKLLEFIIKEKLLPITSYCLSHQVGSSIAFCNKFINIIPTICHKYGFKFLRWIDEGDRLHVQYKKGHKIYLMIRKIGKTQVLGIVQKFHIDEELIYNKDHIDQNNISFPQHFKFPIQKQLENDIILLCNNLPDIQNKNFFFSYQSTLFQFHYRKYIKNIQTVRHCHKFIVKLPQYLKYKRFKNIDHISLSKHFFCIRKINNYLDNSVRK